MSLKVLMTRSPLFLRIWGAGISALGLWYIVSWFQNSRADKDGYSLAVGIFCLIVGMLVIVFNFKVSKNRKDN